MIKKFIIKLNDKLDDPDAKAWDPKLKGTAARKEQWRWTELAKKENKDQWRKIIRRTDGWREREREEAEAKAAAARGRERRRAPRNTPAGSGQYATAAPPLQSGQSNTRAARAAAYAAAREANREQANQQQGGHWN